MREWNYSYGDTAVNLEPRIVRVKNDEQLKVLMQGKLKAAKEMSADCRAEYERRYEVPLDITENSLAMEIWMHYLIQELALRMRKITGDRGIVRKAIRSTAVIDCGEKIEDTNRFAWDLLSIFMKK